MKSLSDELVLFIVEFKDGFLEVTDASVHELGRFTRSP